MTKPKTKPKCQHSPPTRMTWMPLMKDAQRRMAKGDKQRNCPVCGRWVWESLWRKD